MKKIIILALLGSLLVPTSSNAASMKPCPKSKLGTINKNNEKCIKNGIFYRWVKQEAKKDISPAPSPSPKQTESSTTQTSKSQPGLTLEEANKLRIALDPRNQTPCNSYLDRIENNQGELLCMKSENGSLLWYQNFNLEYINPKPSQTKQLKSFEVVYQKINAYYNNNANYKISVFKSPKVNDSIANLIVSKYEKALSLYGIQSNKLIKYVFFNEKEKYFYVEKNNELDSGRFQSWWEDQHCQKEAWSICSYGNGDANNPVFYMVIGSNASWQEKDEHIIYHEVAHMYQMLTFKKGSPACWLMEGQANALGFAMQSKKSDVNSLRFTQMTQISKVEPKMLFLNEREWTNSFKRMISDNNSCYANNIGYSVGMLVIESLFFNYDANLVDMFIIDYSDTFNLSKSLQNAFGINEDRFYDIVGLYIHNSFKEL